MLGEIPLLSRRRSLRPDKDTTISQPGNLEGPRRSFSASVERSLERQRLLEAMYADFDPKTLLTDDVDHGGHDHYVSYGMLHGTMHAIKQLKPTSREALAIGNSIAPADAHDYKGPVPSGGKSAEELADDLRKFHAVLTAYIGEDTILPTAVLARENKVYRIQKYMKCCEPGIGETERQLRAKRRDTFYNELIFHSWPKIVASSDFAALPQRVQQYYRQIGIDRGDGSNACFRGLFSSPEFIIIDY